MGPRLAICHNWQILLPPSPLSLSLPIHRLKLRDRRADGFLLTERLWAFLHTDRLTELRGKGGFLHHALIHDLEQGMHCVSVTSSLG